MGWFGVLPIPEKHLCSHKKDPVTGNPDMLHCSQARTELYCYPEGRFFSPKDDVSPGVGNEVPK